jgi:hypothetical protein
MSTRHRRTVNLVLVLCCLSGSLFADENLLKQADFNGGVILHIGSGDGQAIEEAVAFANKAATISVTRLGAQASVPSLAELKSL